MNKELIIKKVISKLVTKKSKTEEEMDAESDAIQEMKEKFVEYLAKELNKKGFKSTASIEGNNIFLEVNNKDGKKFSFLEEGANFREDKSFMFLYDEDSKDSLEIKFKINDNLDFKISDMTKLIKHRS